MQGFAFTAPHHAQYVLVGRVGGRPGSPWRSPGPVEIFVHLFLTAHPGIHAAPRARPGRPGRDRRPAWPSRLPQAHALAYGGDLGAGVTSRLAEAHPDAVAGIHLLAVAAPPEYDPASLTAEEKDYVDEVAAWSAEEGGYQHQQNTRPLTLAHALSDSPSGLLAWIVEKYRAWSDSNGDLPARFTDDFVLTQASLYWFTNSIATSFRPYYEFAHGMTRRVERVEVPTAVAVFPADLTRPPRSWAERTYNVARYTRMPRGGHFAAHEEPGLLADDITEFFRALR
jgi:pimeloyl-ACP methyl ester carboxylesterase